MVPVRDGYLVWGARASCLPGPDSWTAIFDPHARDRVCKRIWFKDSWLALRQAALTHMFGLRHIALKTWHPHIATLHGWRRWPGTAQHHKYGGRCGDALSRCLGMSVLMGKGLPSRVLLGDASGQGVPATLLQNTARNNTRARPE